MRVTFVTHYDSLYGANRSLLNLLDGLTAYDVEAHVVTPRGGEIAEALRERGLPVTVVPLQAWMARRRSSLGAAWRLFRNILCLLPLARQLREWDSDAIYSNSSVTPFGAMVARLLQRPHVWHIREFGDLDYGLEHDWGTGVFRRVMGWADAHVAVSEAVRSYVLRGVASRCAHVVYNGVAREAEFDRLYRRAHAEASSRGQFTFALVGAIHPNKGQQVAIRALELLTHRQPRAQLVIAGSGRPEHVGKCMTLAAESSVADRIEFLGYVQDPYAVYLQADAVLMCSANEAMGRTTVEAMAACRPVIGYNHGGTAELIQHEHNGLLYQDGPEALAECMSLLMERPAWARELAENAWHSARQIYSTEVYAQQIFKILESVVTARRVGGELVPGEMGW